MKLYNEETKTLNYDALAELIKDSSVEIVLDPIQPNGSEYNFFFTNKITSFKTSYTKSDHHPILDTRSESGKEFSGLNLSFILAIPYDALEKLSEEMVDGISSQVVFVEKDEILFNVVKNENSENILRII